MKLVAVSVEKFRSITTSRRLDVGDATVLVGPNNEGKSNILRALIAGMTILTGLRSMGVRANGETAVLVRSGTYRWERDFPVSLQEKEPAGKSVIGFEFELTDTEQNAFQKKTGSSLNGTLPIEISLGNSDRIANIRVRKPGRGAKSLSSKSNLIAEFIKDRIEFKYIEAVRTAQSAEKIVRDMLAEELEVLEANDKYKRALATIKEIQQPILDQLSVSIKNTLVHFMKDVKSVKVAVSESSRLSGLRTCEIWVDDGTRTELQYKGDGVQSLAALGIMRYASEREAKGKHLLIAIEEPESHLHPDAIHELRGVLYQLAQKHQLIVTTHCPLLVNRSTPSANILVYDNKARPAKSIHEVRSILGVRSSDNLSNAELILVVEGEEDSVSLTAIFKHISARCADAIRDGTLAIDSIGGAGNLSYKLGLYRSMVCPTVCFLDADTAGKRACKNAKDEGLLDDADLVLSTCHGQTEAELEDLWDPAVYKQMIFQRYNVSLDHPKFKGTRKWSERMSAAFSNQGKSFEDIGADVKKRVAACVANNPSNAILSARRGPIDAIVRLLDNRLLGDDVDLRAVPQVKTSETGSTGTARPKLRLVNGKLVPVVST